MDNILPQYKEEIRNITAQVRNIQESYNNGYLTPGDVWQELESLAEEYKLIPISRNTFLYPLPVLNLRTPPRLMGQNRGASNVLIVFISSLRRRSGSGIQFPGPRWKHSPRAADLLPCRWRSCAPD